MCDNESVIAKAAWCDVVTTSVLIVDERIHLCVKIAIQTWSINRSSHLNVNGWKWTASIIVGGQVALRIRCLFWSGLIAYKGMHLLAMRPQNKRHWQLFFQMRNHWIQKSIWLREVRHLSLYEIYVTHGNGAHKTHYHTSRQAWRVSAVSIWWKIKYHTMIRNIVSEMPNVFLWVTHPFRANWNIAENGKSQQQKH